MLHPLKTRLIAPALYLALATAACGPGRAPVATTGSELYGACAACHGEDGSGKVELRAPGIAGLPGWYVGAQLRRFNGNQRGKHPDDVEGLRMRAMARQMLSDAEIDAVAQHVAQLLPAKRAATPAPTSASQPADVEAGKEIYATCATCHGEQGEGNQDLDAPPLSPLDAWYIEDQLQKFQAGIRGTAPGDDVGATMQTMAQTVEPGDIRKVSAYIQTLAK